MTFSLHKKILIFVVLLGVALAFVYYQLFQYIKNTNETASKGEYDVVVSFKKQQYVSSTDKLVFAANPDINKVSNSIVATDGDIVLIEQIESSARSQGITISIDSLSIEDDPLLAGSQMTFLKIKAKTKGSWGNTYQFLGEVESLPYQLRIEHFDMLNSQSISDGGSPSAPITSKNNSEWAGLFEMRVLKHI